MRKSLGLMLLLVFFAGCVETSKLTPAVEPDGSDQSQDADQQDLAEVDADQEDLSSDLGDLVDQDQQETSDIEGQDQGDTSHPHDQSDQEEVVEPVSDCNDGIDNDGDGYVDWGQDLGCANAWDDEISGARGEEQGFTTFDVGSESLVIYVSALEGNDENDGTSPENAVATLAKGAELVRDGQNDFLLLRRGDTWRGEHLGRFKSGQDADHPLVISSYGTSTERPRVEIEGQFIDHNGRARSFVSLVGLELVSYPKIVGDPNFDGSTGGGLRYVGGGQSLLVEDCHFIHCELVVQSYGEDHYEGVEIRRNVVELNYHVNTCGQNNAHRPSGMYASHVTGLTIEENLFDHNGWNEEVDSACATMYNHNLYLNADDLVIRGNVIARASSMGIKMRSDSSGDAQGLVFEDNFFVDGEIGLGIGGNTDEPYRFLDVEIRDNVFSQVGMGNPTERSFSWMLDMSGIDRAIVEGNYFLHQPWYGNAYGISLGSSAQRDITIRENLFYQLEGRALRVQAQDAWGGGIEVQANRFVDPDGGRCLVQHSGGFDQVTYRENSYWSSTPDQWFCGEGEGDLASWEAASGETGATSVAPLFTDPTRTISTYAASLGLDASLEAFLAAGRAQSRHNWDSQLSAFAINSYIKAGFLE